MILAYQSVSVDVRFEGDDVRSQTQQWIEANIPPNTTFAMEYFLPNLDTAVWPVIKVQHLHHNPTEWYEEQGVEYFVVSQAGNEPSRMTEGELSIRQEFIANNCLIESFAGPFLSAEKREMWLYKAGSCE